jgi:hypothetical protein
MSPEALIDGKENPDIGSDLSGLENLPITYQDLSNFFAKLGEANPFYLRKETFLRIERLTNRPLLCYITKTHNVPQGVPAYINDSDLIGFGDLVQSINGDSVDVFIVSNGGSVEASERIVRWKTSAHAPTGFSRAFWIDNIRGLYLGLPE